MLRDRLAAVSDLPPETTEPVPFISNRKMMKVLAEMQASFFYVKSILTHQNKDAKIAT